LRPASRSSGATFDAPGKEKRRGELEALTADPGFWQDGTRAKGVIDELNALRAWLDPLAALARSVGDARALIEMSDEPVHVSIIPGTHKVINDCPNRCLVHRHFLRLTISDERSESAELTGWAMVDAFHAAYC